MPINQRAINQSDFLDWKHNPVTQGYLNLLKQEIEDLKESLASGQTIYSDNLQKTAVETIRMVTRIEELRTILAIDEVEINE